MTKRHVHALGAAGFSWLVCGCSVTRPVPAALDAPSLSSYLAEHPASDLRVTEHSGRHYWVHAPKVQGDSLVGRRGYDVQGRATGASLADIMELRTGHFSLSRTGAVMGGALAAAGVTLAILVENAQPVD